MRAAPSLERAVKRRLGLIVDSHCHVARSWYEPVESLLGQMDRNGVERAVLIQINGQTDNSYQQDCARRYPDRFSSVVMVDSLSPAAEDDLRRLAEEGAVGVRLRTATRSAGEDPLSIWRLAGELGLAVSCAGTAAEYASSEFAGLVESVSSVKIVVEHLGATNAPDANDAERTDRLRAFQLARFPNVYMKIHGLGEICRRAMPVREPFPFEEPVPDLLDRALEAFGPSRLMWGSDYPPVSGREGYRNALVLTRQRLSTRSDGERDMIFGGTALSVFPVRS